MIQVCGARTIVARMEAGDSPTEACLAVLKLIAERTRAKRLKFAALMAAIVVARHDAHGFGKAF